MMSPRLQQTATGWCLEGAVTMATAAALVTQGRERLQTAASGNQPLDLAGVTQVDSAALAVLTAWSRTLAVRDARLQLLNAPPALQQLADLYGLHEILPLTA